jgi:serine/threonine protein kinase
MIGDYKIIKKLGSGQFGTTYLVEKDGKKYAMKMEKIYKKDIKKSFKSEVWREIDFASKLGKKYPNQFTRLYEYDIIDNCKHTQKYDEKFLQKFIDRTKSKFCSRKIYSLVDTTLDKYIDKVDSKNKFYSIIAQICYIIYLMNKNGYTHNDLHIGNIGIVYTDEEYVEIFGKSIKTYGILVKAIDYGAVLHYKYPFGKNVFGLEKDIYNDNINFELRDTLRDIIIDIQDLEDKLYDLNPNIDLDDIIKRIYKSDIGKNIRKKYNTNDNRDVFAIFMLSDSEKFIESVFGKNKKIKLKLWFSIDDLLFILNNSSISKVGKYFQKKLVL